MGTNIRLCAIALLILMSGLRCVAQTVHRFVPNLGFVPMLRQATAGFSTTPAPPIDLGPSAVGVVTSHGFPKQVQFNNPGTAPLTVSAVSFTPLEADFTAESLFQPPITIAAGSSREGAVLFFPQGPGKRTVQFSSTDNAPGSPHMVQFTGTGVVVPANDYAVILDPNIASTVNVPAGGSTTFPIWILAGPGLGNTNVTIQCSGGPTGTTRALDQTSDPLDSGPFGDTRDKIMVTASVPAKSASLRHGSTNLWWACSFALGVLLVCRRRRSSPFFAAFFAVLVMSLVMISCGGSNSGGGGGASALTITVIPTPGTPHTLGVPLVTQ